MVGTKRCTKCGVTKPLSDFGNHGLSKDGYAYRCKQCANAHSKAYRQTPRGIYTRLKGRNTFYKNKPFNLEKEEFLEWFTAEEKKCHYCDIGEEDLPKLSDPFNDFSHRLTVDCKDNSVGYVLENLVLACRRCNSVKSDILTHDEMLYVGQKFIMRKWIKRLEGTANAK